MITFLFIAWLHARPPAEAHLLQPVPSVVSWNHELTVYPVLGHHFNLKSPNRCGAGKLVSAEIQAVSCQMTSPGAQELEVFVCDDAKSFCKREIVSIEVQWPKTISGLWKLVKDYFFH